MVIGTGLLGTAFSSYKEVEDVLIFASGVSNSKTQDPLSYERELGLLKAQLGFKGTLVYFSTCSVADNSLKEAKYIQHKLAIEKWIKENFEFHLIVRLPNLIGKTHNPNTIINFFYHAILKEQPLKIQSDSYRYFVKIEDVFLLVDALLNEGKKRKLIANLITSNRLSILEVVRIFEGFFKKQAIVEMIDQKSDYQIKLDPVFEKYLNGELADGYRYVQEAIGETYVF